MQKIRSFLFAGGDVRQLYAADKLKEMGCETAAAGFENMTEPLRIKLKVWKSLSLRCCRTSSSPYKGRRKYKRSFFGE